MANQEHLEILMKGVDVWNKWREDNPNVKVDLSGANLSGADLFGANLIHADLRGADLRGTILRRAILSGADINDTDFRNAKLSGAKLSGANLRRADFRSADLRNAKLSLANLDSANLRSADLGSVNLRRANLRSADLRSTKLRSAKLIYAEFIHADFHRADLIGADLRKAEITGAKLYGTARDDWKIDGIKCDYVFWDKYVEGRTPKDRNFRPGEFEELYNLRHFERLIERYIEFPPEYKQAGVSILSYFSEIIRQKYPESEATVQIKQDGLKVTMTIDPADGEREIVEKTLNDYGLVITGKMTPEEFFPDNPIQVLKLQNELDIATMKLQQEKRIHELAEKQYGNRIQSLEEEVSWLRRTIGAAIQSRPVIPVTVSPTINVSPTIRHGNESSINAHDVTNSTITAGNDNKINAKEDQP